MRSWIFLVLAVLVLGAAVFVWVAQPGSTALDIVGISRSPRPEPTRQAHLLFVGDIMLSRSVGDLMAAKGDWRWPFRQVASATAGADLAFANLETTVSTRGRPAGCGYCFRADTRALDGLSWAGFDAVSVANNHIWDYGEEAFLDTLTSLAGAQVSPVGGGRDLAEARAPVVYDAAGTKVAYLAYTNLLPKSACADVGKPGANCYDPLRMAEDITRARAAAPVVVVSFHAGEEYVPATEYQRRMYRSAVDAGADLVVGHHPHVTQELERYGRGWIAYSLGNFIFDQNWSLETRRGWVLDAMVHDGAIASVATRSVSISTEYQPGLGN